MGCKSLFFIGIIVSLLVSSFVQSLQNDSARSSLDAHLQHYSYKALARARTGITYKASLPANFSGMEASIIWLKSGSFWARGTGFRAFRLPSKIIPLPYIKRLAIVYQNLGRRSSQYYSVPGYSLVTPVLGLRAYDASDLSSAAVAPLNLNVSGDPISIHFPLFRLPPGSSNLTVRCATFILHGTVSLAKMTLPNVCTTRNQGHFAIVVKQPKKNMIRKERSLWKLWKKWKWWVIGIICGFVGLVFVCMVAMLVVRYTREKKIREMERRADESESFRTVWIGHSRMPSAAVTRTHPVLENGYVP
ncbi:hypothetical protein NE237_028755 [Protea cynaroides]|uniref:Uncharacterized protein n=1 Tax=Protea cynaroides TaxID=273540 RepID=A0A9Q0GSM3_9MAGN|nr:hypothetical protein NE237_028755 [Protea cynaroides]